MAIPNEEPTADLVAEASPPAGFLPDIPALPADAVLLHIGVHKTGTTAVQAAFADARPVLRDHGVYYPGKRPAQHRAALAVLDRPWGWGENGGEKFSRANFDTMAERVQAHDGRVVISTEFLCEASEETAKHVVAALGGDRVHVVVTLRNLGRLLPSSWQQYLKYGMATGYVKWLEDIFQNPGGSSMTPTFWMRQDHAAVIGRWLTAVPPERMTVIVLEDLDLRAVFRTFEQLVALPEGTLQSRMNLTSNRSLTAPEAQLLLDLNRKVALDMPWGEYQRLVRRGLALRMVEDRDPPNDEPRLYTPTWALEAAAEMGARSADFLRGSGVRVLGDLEALGRLAPTGSPTEQDEMREISTEVAVAGLVALLETAQKPVKHQAPSTKALAGELWKRVKSDGKSRVTKRAKRKS